jgi:N-acetylneuraminic acid mutarotase
MGCSGSKGKMVNTGKGIFPGKIADVKNSNVHIQKIVYLFGGNKVLQYDTEHHKITEVKVDPSVKIPTRCQSEFLEKEHKIVILGGMLDGKITNTCLMFSPPDFSKPQVLPSFPKPIRYATMCYFNGVLYAVGGETEQKDPEGISKEVWSLKINPLGAAWEKFCELPMPRRSPNVVIIGTNMYVFGGYAGNKNRTTQIDSVNLTTKEVKKEAFRLPIGVEGARLAWHGDNILLIGGKRTTDLPDSNVMMLDFTNQGIISVRDLNIGRDFPLIIPQKIDEVVVIGGGKEHTAEKRSWDSDVNDYSFKDIKIDGMNLIENPTHYDSALTSFIDNTPTRDHFPSFASGSRIIFGNEIDCFLIEVPESLAPHFYMSPMKLQQKTGQATCRLDATTILLAGGTDVTRGKISSKTYKFYQNDGRIDNLPNLNEPRYVASLVNIGTTFFVVGGKGMNKVALASVEKLTAANEKAEKWELSAPMKQARFGHITWTDANSKIYVLGGTHVDEGKPANDVEVYDVATNTWTVLELKMSPALNGAVKYETADWIYVFGGQGADDLPVKTIYKINRHKPTAMEKVAEMHTARVDPFVMKVGKHIVVMGGSQHPSIEAFDEATWKPETGMEAKSESFFNQLACYTTDFKLENCSFG